MQHTEKTCDPCGASFTPPAFLTVEQAADCLSCSRACSSARARGYKRSGASSTARGSEAIGSLEYDLKCPCEDCQRLRAEDRTALIARVAAERGVPVATGDRPRMTPAGLAALAERIRRARLESYEPVMTELDDEAIV